jgi:hypothetical protein
MESSGLCLQYFIGMGNFSRNCQCMKLKIGYFENIVFENRFISLASYGKSKIFVDGHVAFHNFRHVYGISETFQKVGTKLGTFQVQVQEHTIPF